MITHRKAVLAVALAAVLAGSAACADIGAINETRDDRRAFPFTGARITIDSHSGELRLVAGKGGSVEVERSLTGKATLDGNASWSLDGGTLRLDVVCSGLVPDCGGQHVVHVPPGVAVKVTSDGGPVRAVGLAADLTAEVSDSWLRVENPSGTLRLQAEQNVDVTGARSADLSATSTERNVGLAFAGAPSKVVAKAGSGSVAIVLPEGPETYRISGGAVKAGNSGLSSDPASKRTVTVSAARDVRVRKGR